MGTSNTMERNTNFVLSSIRNNRSALIDKVIFIAKTATEMITTERTIRELIAKLEKAGWIDQGIWK